MVKHTIIWCYKKTSSTINCRPIKFILTKELVRKEYNYIMEQIQNLELHCTMIDGSVANVLTNTNSSSRCFIYNASPTE